MDIYVKGRFIKTTKQNKDFETFYKSQKICEDKEWENFMDSCRDVYCLLKYSKQFAL